ncbi:hypothetical protein DFJ77DRAFT_502117 [Powellomyces hirtus]|nr:hypothetical protein DFJ77DRAFT_502117 [Powellomyces hirtus]
MNKGIGSWFRASSKQDSTNGKSWCGYPYKDYTPGFAPDILQMTGGVHAVYPHPKWAPSAQKYCGLEAIVKNPVNGKTMKLYIVDAFDHQYVKSPGSIDVMIKAWEQLWGGKADSKLKVMKDLQWTLTGNRNPKYAFQGKGDN